MNTDGTINLFDLVMSVSNAVDLVSPDVANHHKRVSYTAVSIACELDMPLESRHTLTLAGLLHDVGALTLSDRLQLLRFDEDASHPHGEVAYLLLRKFRHFEQVATLIRFHHVPWSDGAGVNWRGESVPKESHLLHLADRVDVLIDRTRPVLGQVNRISSTISRESGRLFQPEMVEAFLEVASREYFWLDLVSPSLEQVLLRRAQNIAIEMDWDDLQDFAELLAHVIDFRSPFTATHSGGVAATAAVLASLVGFSEMECEKMKIAGHLHDVGKLAIPSEILEKSGRLTEDEYRIVKSHAYHTHRILEPITGLEDILAWASFHHERLDGNGYPGRRPGHRIPLGARIAAVADVFTALTEKRPYREALSRDTVLSTLDGMAKKRALDGWLVSVLAQNYEVIDRYRYRAQELAHREYDEFRRALALTPMSPQPHAMHCVNG